MELCFIGIHSFEKYELVYNPFRYEGTCKYCGKKDINM